MINLIKIILLLLLFPRVMEAQEIPLSSEQQLENQADTEQGETEDDSWLQDLDIFKKNPININTADADELRQLRVLTDLQIANLVTYRSVLGKLQTIYELQAVPSWDVATIKKILPFVTIAGALSLKDDLLKRFSGGEHTILLRLSQVLERSKGFDPSTAGTKYLGSPQRMFFRYRYTYKNLLQYGLTGDKDAGEQFFSGKQKYGFDFYSFHFFVRKTGIIQALALGDYTVNLGQGLIHWQNLAFKKSVDVMGVKRQSAVLRPYTSSGEFYFHRGAAITIRRRRMESTVFFSFRKLSANYVADTVNHEDYISSFLNSGYHRTESEISDRNRLSQIAAGGNVAYKGRNFHVGVNGVYYKFSLPVQKRDEPYNLYAISGSNWYNESIDYSFTFRNLHFFGEAAIAKNNHLAVVNGLLVSVDPKVDLSVLHRSISAGYQAVNGNAFTENTFPANESGIYAGITIRPFTGWKIDAYCDFFRFPWLKYQVDAPSSGNDYMIQITYSPNKQAEVYTRFRSESKKSNQPDNSTATNYLVSLPRKSWRTQIFFKPGSAITFKTRAEMLWYDKDGVDAENGFLVFQDIIYKSLLSPFSTGIRLQYFNTDGYNSRIYAYENDVPYSYSIPSFFEQGLRYYLNLGYDISDKMSIWLRMARIDYNSIKKTGSGLDEIPFSHKTDFRVQIRYIL